MDTKERFTGRADYYARYRPQYPRALFEYLHSTAGLGADVAVADVGAGTGIFSRQLAAFAGHVFAVEPNAQMRGAAIRSFEAYPNITAVNGSAEDTTLPDASVSFVTAAECFHWFDPLAFRAECARILKPDGKAAILWNGRMRGGWIDEAYTALFKKYSPDYDTATHPESGEARKEQLFGGPYTSVTFENPQRQNREAFIGRLLSTSYSPLAGTPNHDAFVKEAEEIFDAHQQNGEITFSYQTSLYWGPLTGRAGSTPPVHNDHA